MKWYKFHKEHIYLIILAAVGILWRMYPRFLIPSILPTDEYNMLNIVARLVNCGNLCRPFHNSYLEVYLIYAIHLLLKIDVWKTALFINPIIGGLSVFAFYFFVSGVLDRERSLLASVLFTFSEAHFYRTCNFGSTEALGLFLMFIFFGLYFRHRFTLASLFLLIIPFAHTLPFVFSVSIVLVHLLLRRGSQTSILVISMLLVIMFIVTLTGLLPAAMSRMLTLLVSNFSLSDTFMYSVPEVLVYLPCFSGVVVMSVMVLLKFKEWNEICKIFFFVSVVGMIVSLLCYGIVSPVRFLVYITIPLIFVVSEHVKDRKFFALLVVVMVASPLVDGLDRIVLVPDSITAVEIEAVEWIMNEGYFTGKGKPGYNYTRYGTWFFDSTVHYYVCWYGGVNRMSYETFLNYKDRNASWEFQLGQAYQPCYVFLSERMKKGAFIVDWWENGTRIRRSVVKRVPIEDIWKDDLNFREIYNKNGVVIYENEIFFERKKAVAEKYGW